MLYRYINNTKDWRLTWRYFWWTAVSDQWCILGNGHIAEVKVCVCLFCRCRGSAPSPHPKASSGPPSQEAPAAGCDVSSRRRKRINEWFFWIPSSWEWSWGECWSLLGSFKGYESTSLTFSFFSESPESFLQRVARLRLRRHLQIALKTQTFMKSETLHAV